MRPALLLRSVVITAALGGAVLVPTAAFADSPGPDVPASAAAPALAQEHVHEPAQERAQGHAQERAQGHAQVQVRALAPTGYRTGARYDSEERPATAASDGISANPYFLIAGGSMAAAGAAGLVYSTVRRGRADG